MEEMRQAMMAMQQQVSAISAELAAEKSRNATIERVAGALEKFAAKSERKNLVDSRWGW